MVVGDWLWLLEDARSFGKQVVGGRLWLLETFCGCGRLAGLVEG